MSTYRADIVITKDGATHQIIQGVVEQVYVVNETEEKSDGVVIWREPTGRERITITVLRSYGEANNG